MNNNIIFGVTRKYMKLNRRRTAIAFIGIVFMVLLMTCVFAGKRTVLDYIERVASLEKGSWHVIAYDLTPEETERVSALPEVTELGRSEPLSHIDFPQTADPGSKPYLDVKSYSRESFDMMNITAAEGRLPENSSEIIISASAVSDGSEIKVGDRISGDFFDRTITGINPDLECTEFPLYGISIHYGETVTVPAGFPLYEENTSFREDRAPTGRSGDFTVVGIMETPSFEKQGAASYAALCGESGEGSEGSRVNVMIRLDTSKVGGIEDFEQTVRKITGRDTQFDLNEMLLMMTSTSSDSNINSLVTFFEIFFTVFIMAASVILIYNVFGMSFAERTRYLGMLSSVGATRRQKRQSIYYESFALLIPALPIGIIAGIGTVAGAMKLLAPRLGSVVSVLGMKGRDDIPVHISAGAWEIVLIVIMSAATVMISALIPAIKISRTAPIESIRSGDDNGNKKRREKKSFATKKGLLERGKPELLLASASTSRSKHLTKSIIRSITVFAVISVVTLYGAQSIIKILDILSSDSGWTPEMKEEGFSTIIYTEGGEKNRKMIKDIISGDERVLSCKEIDNISMGVYADRDELSDEYVSAYKEIFLQFSDNTEADWEETELSIIDRTNLNLIVVDDEEYALIASKGDADMSIASDPSVPSIIPYNDLFFSTDRYTMGNNCKGYKYISVHSLFKADKGSTVDLSVYDSEKGDTNSISLTVAGFADEESVRGRFNICGDTPYLFVNRAAADLLYPDRENTDYEDICHFFLLREKENSGFCDEMTELAEQLLKDDDETFIGVMEYDVAENIYGIKQVLAEIIKILAYCFTALISAVCLLNLYNSIRGRAAERTKETAILRSLGMTDRQLTRMHDTENLMLIGKGLAAAAVICTLLILTMRHFITGFFGAVQLPLPIAVSLIVAAVIAVSSSVMTRVCTGGTSGKAIIEEIRRETV